MPLCSQWDIQNKGKSCWSGTSSPVLEVPLCNLRPSIIYSVPCDRIYIKASNLLSLYLQILSRFCIKTSQWKSALDMGILLVVCGVTGISVVDYFCVKLQFDCSTGPASQTVSRTSSWWFFLDLSDARGAELHVIMRVFSFNFSQLIVKVRPVALYFGILLTSPNRN